MSEIESHQVQTVNARDVHAFLGVGTAFNDWIARRIEEYGFIDGQDFTSFLTESSGGRPATDYALTLSMAKELCMVERNEQGKRARQYFIECERRALAQVAQAPKHGFNNLAQNLHKFPLVWGTEFYLSHDGQCWERQSFFRRMLFERYREVRFNRRTVIPI